MCGEHQEIREIHSVVAVQVVVSICGTECTGKAQEIGKINRAIAVKVCSLYLEQEERL